MTKVPSPPAASGDMTPLPLMQMFSIIMVQFCEAINVNVLFPFLAFMIEDLGYGGHRLGYYAGGLAAAFCGAQFCSSVLWGLISDRYGRKLAIVVGTFGTALGMLVFGTARNYPQAVAGRALGGFLCGNIGIMKCFITEITDDSNRGKAFAWLSVSWSTGVLVAPLLGGMLCNPADKFPQYFSRHGLFATFPYLLPCLFAVVINLFTALCCAVFMKESRRALNGSDKDSDKVGVEMVSPARPSRETKREPSARRESLKRLLGVEKSGDGGSSAYRALRGDEDEEDEIRCSPCDDDVEAPRNPLHTLADESSHGLLHSTHSHNTHTHHTHHTHIPKEALDDPAIQDSLAAVVEDLERDADSVSSDESESESESDAEGEQDFFAVLCCEAAPRRLSNDSAKNVLRQRTVVLAVSNYGLLAMSYILLDETIPLFLKLSQAEGGLQFSSAQIGLLLSLSGLAMLVFSSTAMPVLASKSKKALFEAGAVGGAVCVFLWPLLALANRHWLSELRARHAHVAYQLSLWALLLLTSVLKNVFGSCAFTAVMIQVNHSVAEDFLGAVNGLGQSLAALARAVGPALGGLLWSVSIQRQFVFLNFLGVAAAMAGCVCVNRLLPDSIDRKKVLRRRENEKETETRREKETRSDSAAPMQMMH